MDFLDAVTSTSKSKSSTSKSKSKKEIVVAPKDIQVAIEDFSAAKKEKKAAEARMEKHEGSILSHCQGIYDKNGFSGKFSKSFHIGNENNSVNFVTANRFSVASADVGIVKEILGESADALIKTEHEVKIKSAIFTDKDLQKKLMDLVGENFAEFFETVTTYSVVEDFDSKIFSALDTEGINNLRQFVKQSKPSLR
jgi:hypothetical protein